MSAKSILQSALTTYPGTLTIQRNAKASYAAIALQIRTTIASKALSASASELQDLCDDIFRLDSLMDIKTRHLAYLEKHMAAFQRGIQMGAKDIKNEGRAMHWDAEALITFVEKDKRIYSWRVETFELMEKDIIAGISPVWLKGVEDKVEGVDDDEGLEKMATMQLKEVMVGTEYALGGEGGKKTSGRLKGKARKEAKSKAAAETE